MIIVENSLGNAKHQCPQICICSKPFMYGIYATNQGLAQSNEN